jgi:hypothetical protein
MKYTRETIIDKIKSKDTDFFYEIYSNLYRNDEEVETVYDQHWGDGNEYYISLHFKKLDMYVLLDGTYSSWDSPYWDSVSHAEPYQFTETRYKPATLEYIRDKKLEKVLAEDKPVNE